MANKIDQYAIGDLLDGRYFFIPAYQRGYRWCTKQVGDLLRDLLCFVNKKEKEDFEFYCLQPVITRPITDRDTIIRYFGEDKVDDVIEKGAWEVIDGQQRLTSIFIIYKFLLNDKKYSAEKLWEREKRAEFHLYYETRSGSTRFLEQNLYDWRSHIDKNIDFFHMGHAYAFISEWIKSEGTEINERFGYGCSYDDVRDSLYSLINRKRDNRKGSVQVLWYELEEAKENRLTQSSIKEFQKINTGIIKLTTAELIKGLFLQEKNFIGTDKVIRQSELALEWEFIENTLHNDNFWFFLQKKGVDMPNRIDLLFILLYKISKLSSVEESLLSSKLKEIDSELSITNQDSVFRFFNNKFEGKSGLELGKAVADEWQKVMELFRMLDDWFSTPYLYNTIGLLSQCGEDLAFIILHFMCMDENSRREDFLEYLRGRVRLHLESVKVNHEEKFIESTFKERSTIYKLLLTLNIHLLNEQNKKFESESEVYKFPFDVLNSQNWDIEHIDSFKTNSLTKEQDQLDWINVALEDLHNLPDEKREEICLLRDRNAKDDYAKAIEIIKKFAGEVDNDEDIKNSLGNLTLLDSQTNRKYGNSLFCTKRRIIIERIKSGVFIPTGTQYVFYKLFDNYGTNRSQWTQKDMETYNSFIYTTLKDYLSQDKD